MQNKIGMALNDVTIMGVATAVPEMVGEWISFILLTDYYDFGKGEKVQVPVKIMTRNPSDVNVISSYVPAGKQVLIKGSYQGWQNPDGSNDFCVVPSLIKLGVNGSVDFLGLTHNDCIFIGRVNGAFSMLGTDYISFNLLTEHVEKTADGYSEVEMTVPVLMEALDRNVNFANKFIQNDRQLKVSGPLMVWETGHAFLCRRPDLGMKPRTD